MKTLCILLGVATILFGAYIWLNTPISTIPDYANPVPTLLYRSASIGCVIGGFFWFVLARILENQDQIKKALNIKDSDKPETPSILRGKVF